MSVTTQFEKTTQAFKHYAEHTIQPIADEHAYRRAVHNAPKTHA